MEQEQEEAEAAEAEGPAAREITEALSGAAVGDREYLVDIHQAMADYEAGTSPLIDDWAYGQLQLALDHCHTVLGAEGDRPSA